ncbi:TOMM precursor leader peptide-binding protein [Streptomyces iranensis]|uniref:Bacteriocin biosynthesis cyclodehydratase domain-containing protein n=1 Tax=Streptomyces iranensis TaxID=576784 RepID=A0A060ZTY2_9ACTN|nr:TOMM precursor leader peptide-binding protein [Streptomyces iranensis]MBP2061585.1 ribosomal protein S12 methylthiotransferase accessory factor [Streptomyces iranensis]CDR09590.1 bacteriocin biosynthesis cyclodehydratase domain-containing protein [Streptomyces iranensis]
MTGELGFTPHLRVEPVPGEAVYLVSEHGVTALHGRAIAALAPLLDGSRDLAHILTEAAAPGRAAVPPAAGPPGAVPADAVPADAVPAGQAERVIARLRAAGLVSEREHAWSPEEAYWELAGLGTGGSAPAPTPASARPAVAPLVLGSTGPDEVVRALRVAGLGTVDGETADPRSVNAEAADGDPTASGANSPRREICQIALRQHGAAELTLVVCDDYLDPRLAAVDAAHRAAGRRWLPVKPVGTQAWLGPFLGAPDDPCWVCLADRLWRGRQAEAYLQRRLGRPGPVPRPPASLPASRAAALQLAALEAAKWLAGYRHPGQRELRTLDSLTATVDRHPLSRRPQCAGCGDPALVAARIRAPLSLPSPREPQESREPREPLTETGTAADTSPRGIMERYGHLVDPVTGLVTEIRRDPRGPAVLNCFHARHPSYAGAGPHSGLDAVRAGLGAAAHGKGRTAEQARASALCEALEHYSGHFQGDEPRQRARYRDLRPEDAVHPDTVQLFDPRQFRDPALPARHRVQDPFDEGAELDWTPVWSLTAERHRLLPTALLYYGAPQPPGHRCCRADSNGAAAGGTLADAVVRGFLELVERDAVALWWYNRTRQPAVALDAFDDSWLAEVRAAHRGVRREVWALDLTTDFGIPVVAALSRRLDKPAEDITFGFGAHFDRHTALCHAFAELNQMLPAVVEARADGGGYGAAEPEALRWFRTATLVDHPYLAPDPAAVPPPGTSGPPEPPEGGALATVGELARGRGLELLVLDQTRPDVGLPVAKVLVPGMRPHWARFAPGRLFDAPVALGRLPGPTPYADLNPIPFFL